MKKWAIGIGIILLLVTSILLTSYNRVFATPKTTQGLASTGDLSTWECAGNFTKDDVIFVELLPNIFWAENPSAFDILDNNVPVMYVDLNITDPKNTMSQYELWLTYDQTTNRFSVYNASALSFGEGINSTIYLPNKFNVTYTFYAGRAMLNGTYFANITSAGYAIDYRADGTYKPAAFELFYARTTFDLSQPYTSMLYIGYATIPSSIIFLVYGGLKRTKPTRKVSNRDLRHQPRTLPISS
jgi:hypothetical protein